MDLSELNTEFTITHHNEADKLPSLTLNGAQKGAVRLRAVATIDGQDASDKTWDEFAEALAQGRDVALDFGSAPGVVYTGSDGQAPRVTVAEDCLSWTYHFDDSEPKAAPDAE